MPRLKLLLDTNIVIDFANVREPFYEKARMLMIAGRVGEFDLWISSSQVTDLVYILSEGGKHELMADTLERLRALRTFVDVFPASDTAVDKMLSTTWKDPEDALLFEIALELRADAIVTRNQNDSETELIKVVNCNELFDWVSAEWGIDYAEVEVG